MSKDIEIKVTFIPQGKGINRFTTSLKGDIEDIQKQLSQLTVKELPTDLKHMTSQMSRAQKMAEKLAKSLQRTGGTGKVTVKQKKALSKQDGHTVFFDENNLPIPLDNKTAKDVFSVTGGGTRKNTGKRGLASQLQSEFRKAKANLRNQMKIRMGTLRGLVDGGGPGATKAARELKMLAAEMKRLSRTTKSFAKTRDLESGRRRIKDFAAVYTGAIKKIAGASRKQPFSEMRREMERTFGATKQNVINTYIMRMRALAGAAQGFGPGVQKAKRELALLREELNRLNKTKFRFTKGMTKEGALPLIQQWAAERIGNLRGISGKAGSKGMRAMLQNISRTVLAGISGTAGFTLITAGHEVQQMAKGKRFTGQIAGAMSTISEQIGSLFGTTIGSIGGDLGKAIGNVFEAGLNIAVFPVKQAIIKFGSMMKGYGYVVASGAMGAFAGASLGIFGGPIGMAAGAAVGIAAGYIAGLAHNMVAQIGEIFNEIIDLASKIVDSVVQVISAGLKVIGALIKGAANLIKSVWIALWTGVRELTKVSFNIMMDGITLFAQKSVDIVKRTTKSYISLFTRAFMAAKEIMDVDPNATEPTTRVIASMAGRYGFSREDVSSSYFDVLSSGYRDVAESLRVLSSAARIATLDQTSMAQITNAMITTFQNFGHQQYSAAQQAEMLAAATTLGRMTLQDLAPSLKHVAGLSASFGMDLKGVLASLTTMSYVLGRGGMQSAARYYARFIESIRMPRGPGKKIMDALGMKPSDLKSVKGQIEVLEKLNKLSETDLETMMRPLFPTSQARKAFLALAKNVEKYKSVIRDLDAVMGAQDQVFNEALSNLENRMKRVSNILENIDLITGRLGHNFMKSVFYSDKIMTIWSRINKFLTSDRVAGAIKNTAKYMTKVLEPLETIFSTGLLQFARVMDMIVRGDFFSEKNMAIIKETFSFIGVELSKVAEVFERYFSAEYIRAFANSFMDVGEIAVEAIVLAVKYLKSIDWKTYLQFLKMDIGIIVSEGFQWGLNSLTKLIADTLSKLFQTKLNFDKVDLGVFTGLFNVLRAGISGLIKWSVAEFGLVFLQWFRTTDLPIFKDLREYMEKGAALSDLTRLPAEAQYKAAIMGTGAGRLGFSVTHPGINYGAKRKEDFFSMESAMHMAGTKGGSQMDIAVRAGNLMSLREILWRTAQAQGGRLTEFNKGDAMNRMLYAPINDIRNELRSELGVISDELKNISKEMDEANTRSAAIIGSHFGNITSSTSGVVSPVGGLFGAAVRDAIRMIHGNLDAASGATLYNNFLPEMGNIKNSANSALRWAAEYEKNPPKDKSRAADAWLIPGEAKLLKDAMRELITARNSGDPALIRSLIETVRYYADRIERMNGSRVVRKYVERTKDSDVKPKNLNSGKTNIVVIGF